MNISAKFLLFLKATKEQHSFAFSTSGPFYRIRLPEGFFFLSGGFKNQLHWPVNNQTAQRLPISLYINQPKICFRRCPVLISDYYFAGVFADGPGAYLFHGVVEQQYVFHVMDYALCLSESKQKSCEKHVTRGGKLKAKSGALPLSVPSLFSLLLIAILFV